MGFDIETGLHVTSTVPLNGATDVPTSMPVAAVFSEEISFPTITDKSFIVADSQYVPITGTYTYDAASKTVTFTPFPPLSYLSEYNVLITTDVTDAKGNNLNSEKIWYFTTMPASGTIASPFFTPVPGTYEGTQTVTIDCPDPNAAIRYTLDGSTPTSTNGILYLNPITISVNTIIPLSAVAYRQFYTDSPIATAMYGIQAMTPAIMPPPGHYNGSLTITLSTSTTIAGTMIIYTDDGTNPLSSVTAQTYSSPFSVTAPSTTIQAVAINPQMMNSPTLTAVYIIDTAQVAPPVFSPAPGTYTSALTVTLSTTTPGATIRYTTDGSDPSLSNGIDGTRVTVTDTMVLKAYAFKVGMLESSITNSAGVPYIIAPRITSITPNKGPNNNLIAVIIRGRNFKPGAIAELQLGGSPTITASPLTVVDSTTINCTFDITGAQPTKWDVVVSNPDGGSSTNVKFFRIY
jgi:hypothetical protein